MPGKCLYCRRAITWAEQRRQLGRLIRRGGTITYDEAKRLMPRCQKCLTVLLRQLSRA